MRKFRFAVQSNAADIKEWHEFARRAEDLGYDVIVYQDHFGVQFAPLLAIVSAAAVTSRIRFGTLVLDNDFRHPATMAKEAASVDALTGGRFELGLGAGWMMPDYQKTGIPFGEPGERYERLLETVKIVKSFFHDDAVTFKGKHYTIEGLDSSPKTVQKPHPPILIGGRQKRMLRMAGREADIVGISMLDRRAPGQPPPPTVSEKVEWVKEAAGDRWEDIEIHVNSGGTNITDNQRAAIEEVANRQQIAPEDVLKSTANLIGSVDALVDQIQGWRENASISFFNVPVRVMEAFAPVVARLSGK